MNIKKIDRIAAELRRIADANGGVLLPEIVVEKARPSTSPLHSRFTWDDSEAADRYRIWQARQLIRVCVEKITGVSTPTEVFVSLTKDRYAEGGYRVTTEVLSNKQMREELLNDAITELQIFQLKYQRLRELSNVFKAIKSVAKTKSK